MSDIVSRPSLDEDLIAVYLFEGNFNDTLENYNGVEYGAVDWGDGVHGQAPYFDGTNDYVIIPTLPNFPYTDYYSVSLWFKWVGNGTGGSGAEKLLDKTTWYHDWYIWIHRSGDPYDKYIGWTTYESGGAGCNVTDSTHRTDGLWHHVVVTYSNTTGKIYHQGVLKNTATMKKVNSGVQWRISHSSSGDSNQHGHINAWIDNYTIWSKAITEDDVIWLYNNGVGVEYPYTKPMPSGYDSYEEWVERQEVETAVEESLEEESVASIARKVINPKTVVLIDTDKESVVL